MNQIPYRQAVAAGVLTDAQADAIAGALVFHAAGAVDMNRQNLRDDELEALDRLIVWCECAGWGVQ